MENSTCPEDIVMEDVEVKIEIKEEIETEAETDQSVKAENPHDNFDDESSNPERATSYYGNHNSDAEGDEGGDDFYYDDDEEEEENSNDDDFDEYQDPLAQLDAPEENEDEDEPGTSTNNKSPTLVQNQSGTTKLILQVPQKQRKMKPWRFLCQNCPADFHSYEELVEHENSPHDPQIKYTNPSGTGKLVRKSRPAQCLLCFIWAPGELQLKRHLRHHAGPSPHSCPCCSHNLQPGAEPGAKIKRPIFSSTSFEEWLNHMNKNHRNRLQPGKNYSKIKLAPFICKVPLCYQHFYDHPEFKEHISKHHKSKIPFIIHPCPHPGCGRQFSKDTSLRHHMKTKHKPKLAAFFPCEEPGCSRQFKTENARKFHMKDHKLSFICPEKEVGCSMEFYTQQDFDNHIRAHELPPPVSYNLICNYCSPNRLFPSEMALQEHFDLKHAHPCPINLPKCPPNFASAFLRNIHMLEKHQDEQDCSFESQKYPTLSAVSSFLRCNHGNCSVQFKTNSQLLAHIKEKKHKEHKYTCPAFSCTHSPTRYANFVLHFGPYPHHDPCNPDFQPHENPWSCPICLTSEKCQSPAFLQKHALTEHNFLNFPCPFIYPGNPGTENVDDDEEKKPMKCGMIFDSFHELNQHWKIYGEHFPQDPKLYFSWLKTWVPVPCSHEDCPEEFMSQSEMKAHFPSHFSAEEQIPKCTVSKRLQKPRPRVHRDKDKDQGNEEKEQVEQPQIQKETRKRKVVPPKKFGE